jgi:phosphatidylinositol alpha-1,6-mannosyltransferase
VRSLVVVDRYMPHRGGSRRYYHELARRLPDAEVLTGPQPGWRAFDASSGVRTLRRRGIRPNYASRFDSVRHPVLNLLLAYGPGLVATTFWLAWELLRARPRCVHAGGYAFAGFAARIACPALRVPWVVYAHGEDVSSTARRRIFRHLMTWVYRAADRVIVNCDHTADLVVAACGIARDRIVVARPGVDAKWLSAAGERRGDVTAPMLLTVGRLVPHKGHATVLEALPSLLGEWPGLKWVLVGQGPEGERLQRRTHELGLEGHVVRMADVTDVALHDIYANADVFVQPNGNVGGAHEGYGMVFLEAGAAGIPVVGGRDGGVPEAILEGETGLLVPPFDVAALATALRTLLADTALRGRLGEGGRQAARQRTWDRTLAPAVALDRELSGVGAARPLAVGA